MQPQHRSHDDEAEEYSESIVVNISDEPVTILIGTAPGSKPRRYTFAPYGEHGDRQSLQTGYTKPYKGAGRQMCTAIIERLTMRSVHAATKSRNEKGELFVVEAPRLPMVVHVDDHRAARERWLDVMSHAPKSIARPAANAQHVAATATRAPSLLVGEEVGQDEIEPPHPDDDPIIADGPPIEEVPLRRRRSEA